MGILTKEVEVRPTGKMIQYYRDRGYDAKYNQPLIVDVNDLSKNSHIKIDILCDMCKKNIMSVSYQEYNVSIEHTGSYVCKQCSPKKVRQSNLKKYGVPNVRQVDEIKNRSQMTMLERYGVKNYAQTEDYHKKMEHIMMERYGVKNASQMDGHKEKCRNTCIEKYGEDYGKHFSKRAISIFEEKTGYSHPLRSPTIKEKRRQTNIERYGVVMPSQLPEVREKMSQALYSNSSQKVSRQQHYINNIYQGILNFPVKYYNVDIYLPEDNLIIEYDGGGHMLNVVTGRESIDEYNQKEIIRNNIIKKEGYKQMRIISSKDTLPYDQILLQMLLDARSYFSLYPNHSWIEFNINTSTVRNAENKDGTPYQFGSLRTIKDNDINDIQNNIAKED